MKETTGWVFTGILAGVAMFSLATAREAAPSMNDPISVPRQQLASLDEAGGAANFAARLADAYFAIARAEGPADPDQEDWELRHQMTLKGFDAEQGLNLSPESPDRRGLSKGQLALLEKAAADLRHQMKAIAQDAASPGELVALTAALQAQYDWWLLGCESGWDATKAGKARARFEDTLAALTQARLRGTLAAL